MDALRPHSTSQRSVVLCVTGALCFAGQECNDPCCNATTCQLVPGAQCSSDGICCDNCKVGTSGRILYLRSTHTNTHKHSISPNRPSETHLAKTAPHVSC